MAHVMVVSGEASGDLHAARLVSHLRASRSDLEFFGLAGDEMLAVGVESVAHSREIAVVGIAEVFKILPRAKQIFDALLKRASELRPDVAILGGCAGL